jgi:6,7-dimethyl-8-ribityllumazine synthase
LWRLWCINIMRMIEGTASAVGIRFVLVVSKFNDFVTDRLQAGALGALASAGADPKGITVVRVPGAFEIPIAAQHAAQSGAFSAVVCLGCIVRGETPHFEYLAAAVSGAIAAAAAETGVPMTFGVLTTNTIEEAIARAGEGPANKGWEAATAAVEMVGVISQLGHRHPPPA